MKQERPITKENIWTKVTFELIKAASALLADVDMYGLIHPSEKGRFEADTIQGLRSAIYKAKKAAKKRKPS